MGRVGSGRVESGPGRGGTGGQDGTAVVRTAGPGTSRVGTPTGVPGAEVPAGPGGRRLCQPGGFPAPHPAPRSPQAYAAVAPPGPGRLLKAGAAVLIAGALLLLAGAIGAFYFWKATERQVSAGGRRAWKHILTSSSRAFSELVSCKERQRMETLLARSIKRSLSRSLFFFHAFKKKKNKPQTKKQTHNHYLYWLFGWRLLEAHFLMNMKCIFESTDATLISARKSSANSNPNKSLGIHILGKLQLPGQKKALKCVNSFFTSSTFLVQILPGPSNM